jgi:hypothetical protein
MKKFILITLMLVSTLSFAHEKTKADKKAVYTTIKKQLNEGKIDIKTAQKMWKAYLYCCKE